MQLLTLGLNHTTAPLAVRERVAFLADEVGATIGRLRERLSAPAGGRVSEAAIVSTCNRTELYCAVEEPISRSRHCISSSLPNGNWIWTNCIDTRTFCRT